jgi:hypothetical protein
MAPPGAHAGHDHPVLPVTDAARPHRLSPSAPCVGLAGQRGRLRSSPRQTPAAPLRASPRALRNGGAAIRPERRAVAWPCTCVVDGSGGSMPDTLALQEAFGPPTAQRHGCGVPVARLLGLFHAGPGVLLKRVVAPLLTHDLAQVQPVHPL